MKQKLPIAFKLFCLWIFLFFAFSLKVYTAESESPVNVSSMSEQALQGKFLWQKKNCTACHQFYGLGGYMGPDLTNVMSKKGKGEVYARSIIKYGLGAMPNFGFNDSEVESLVSYLKYVDSSGNFPPRHIARTWYGSFYLK